MRVRWAGILNRGAGKGGCRKGRMNGQARFCRWGVLTVCGCLGSAAQAAVFFDSSPSPITFSQTVKPSYVGVGQSFQSAPEPSFLTAVTLQIGDAPAGSDLAVSLYDSTGPDLTPGIWLAQFSLGSPVVGESYPFNLAAPLPLLVDHTYWVVAAQGAGGTSSYAWYGNSGEAPAIGSAVGWGTDFGDGWTRNSGANLLLTVTGTTVPEPSVYGWVAGSALLVFVAARRRGRREKTITSS